MEAMNDRVMDRIRLLNIDTGTVREAIPVYAYSVERMRNREALLGRMQTHLFVERKDTGRIVCVTLKAYQENPSGFIHPMHKELSLRPTWGM